MFLGSEYIHVDTIVSKRRISGENRTNYECRRNKEQFEEYFESVRFYNHDLEDSTRSWRLLWEKWNFHGDKSIAKGTVKKSCCH